MVTSFSSKSEIGAQPVDRRQVRDVHGLLWRRDTDRRLQRQHARRGRPDQSGAPAPIYRVVAERRPVGQFQFTKTNAYSGNNGRAAILNNEDGANVLYTAGNAGNGSNPQPTA